MAQEVIIVEFYDITDCCEWTPLEDAKEVQARICQAVGFKLNEDILFLRLASLINDTHAGGFVVIPQGCILKRRDIKEEDEEPPRT